MNKPGRPANPYKTPVPPVDQIMDHDQDDPLPHEVNEAMDTIQKAHEHQANPKMMRAIGEASGKKISSLKALRNLANKKALQNPMG